MALSDGTVLMWEALPRIEGGVGQLVIRVDADGAVQAKMQRAPGLRGSVAFLDAAEVNGRLAGETDPPARYRVFKDLFDQAMSAGDNRP